MARKPRPYNGSNREVLVATLLKRDRDIEAAQFEESERGKDIMRIKKISEMLEDCEVKTRINHVVDEFDFREPAINDDLAVAGIHDVTVQIDKAAGGPDLPDGDLIVHPVIQPVTQLRCQPASWIDTARRLRCISSRWSNRDTPQRRWRLGRSC